MKTIATLTILILLASCTKPDDLVCYECQSKVIASWVVIGTTAEEMQKTISERIRVTGDTMRCYKIECK